MAFSTAATEGGDAEGLVYLEGRDVTASQELEAMEDDDVAPARVHLGFSDPLHSQEDVTFHHEQELLPPGALYDAARVRAPSRPQAAEAAGAPEAAAEVETEAEGGAEVQEEEQEEEDGWTRWQKFKAGTLPPEEMEYYRGLQEQDEAAADQLPEWLQPRDAREKARIKWLIELQDKLLRVGEEEAYEDEAWAIHHYQNETGWNRYMNARQLAGYMAQVELEDHQAPNPELMRFGSWARAEHRWAHDYDAFNAHVEEHMADYVIKLPPGAEDAEDIDILDDVLLLSDERQGAALTSAGAARELGDGGGGAGSDGEGDGAAEGLDQFLVGVLPGGGGGGGAEAEGFAEEMLGEDLGDDDVA